MGYLKNGLFSKLCEKVMVFFKHIISEEKHPFKLKFSGYNKDHEIYCWGNFQVDISCCGFVRNIPQYAEIHVSKMTITREERPNGTNPFRVFICIMSPINEKNMSANRRYQLERFPHQFWVPKTRNIACFAATKLSFSLAKSSDFGLEYCLYHVKR
jgi:hypothetical protein